MSRRLSFIACAALLSSAVAAQAGTKTPQSWAAPEIRAVAAAGMMGAKDVQTFRASDPLTAQALENLVYDIKVRETPAPEGGDPGNQPGAPTTTTTPTTPAVTDPTQTTTTPTTTATTTTPTTTTTPAPAPLPPPKQIANGGRPVEMWELDARLVDALGLSDAAAEFAKGARAAGLTVPP